MTLKLAYVANRTQGYTYTVFNLVYENNVASCRIWDALGFKRIGKVPGGGRLRSCPGQYVDAIIYGRDLNLEGDESVTQDRFDKIRYYLKHSTYPQDADRAEKSRLRSAATHYKLVGGTNGEPEKLMLKDKEVVADPHEQYDIARHIHVKQHGGINKTTAAIALQYHWVRIKETVSRVIRDCPQCKETLKSPTTNDITSDDPPVLEDANDAKLLREGTKDQLMGITSVHSRHTQEPFTTAHEMMSQTSDYSMEDYASLPLDPQIIDIHEQLPHFRQHDTMDTYMHDALRLPNTPD